MVSKELLSNYLSAENINQKNLDGIILNLIEYIAIQNDNIAKNELLKNLILKYANLEKELIKSNSLKNKIIGIAAHDLKNPLSSIRGLSEILIANAGGYLKDNHLEILQVINKISTDMMVLINDLLDLTIIESGKLELNLNRCSIKSIIDNVIRFNEINATKKEITLHTSFKEVSDIVIDKTKIYQAIDNLVSNAIKFSLIGSNVYINLIQENTKTVISVRDEGPGISKENQKRLFKEFEKLGAKPTGGEQSTGLGLSIAKKIINAHKGELLVESSLGCGTTFSIILYSKSRHKGDKNGKNQNFCLDCR